MLEITFDHSVRGQRWREGETRLNATVLSALSLFPSSSPASSSFIPCVWRKRGGGRRSKASVAVVVVCKQRVCVCLPFYSENVTSPPLHLCLCSLLPLCGICGIYWVHGNIIRLRLFEVFFLYSVISGLRRRHWTCLMKNFTPLTQFLFYFYRVSSLPLLYRETDVCFFVVVAGAVTRMFAKGESRGGKRRRRGKEKLAQKRKRRGKKKGRSRKANLLFLPSPLLPLSPSFSSV